MLLVAVSGGIDSMCLAEKVRLEGGPFAVAHCNFSLRGAESDGDEAFVRDWCSRHGVVCHVKRFDTAAYASTEGISIEMAARRLRYHWFGELCREHGYEAVAVAHNANDNAETLLLNLLRGTGLRGITGMKATGFLPDPSFGDIPLLRPLLGLTREEISAFAAGHGLSWREDASNAENNYKRNKIRNLVFPIFRQINPRFIETLNRDMERFAEELVMPGTPSVMPGTPSVIPGTPSVIPSEASVSPSAMRFSRASGPRNDSAEMPDSERTSDGGPRVARNSGTCPFSPVEYAIREEPWDGTKEVKQPEGMLIVDADKAGELTEGRWESGDWIKPLGAPGKKKLQDWFTDHHIPADEKPLMPLLKAAEDPHHVLAIVGHCIDHSVRVTPSTRRILRISVKNM